MKAVARVLLTIILVAAGCAGGYELSDYYMLSPWTRDARVQADVVSIAPDISGFVNDLRVKDNQFVHKGDILFILDRERYARALATAEAVVAARKAEMDMRQHEAARRAKLTTLAISDEAREDAALTANSTAAAYQQALADRSTAQLNLDRTVMRAPVNGFVTNLTLDVGQYASVGTKVMALLDSDSYRVTGYFEETKIPAVKQSRRVDIYLMSGGSPLRGHVESISRGITDRDNPAGPELLANANPTFEWVRLAQRIPVRIHIDDVPKGVLISSGMTCTVVVESPPRQWAVVAALGGWAREALQ
ncbi:MAG: efflux RND transporter periplasmic adaptor subunit [Alphaproteobacteria bacterium]|nr:efflux RND transporter periplasmic adaptor subunit [Alphaproteobacteria bacterium]